MELSFNELKKRDVINVPDGRCLGRITDIRLEFPRGILSGIVVPGRKNKRFCGWFDKTEIFIGVQRIIKIGGDVILVDISSNKQNKNPHCPPPPPHCPSSPQHCPPSPPHCPPPENQFKNVNVNGGIDCDGDLDNFSFDQIKIDMSDY